MTTFAGAALSSAPKDAGEDTGAPEDAATIICNLHGTPDARFVALDSGGSPVRMIVEALISACVACLHPRAKL